MWGPHLPREWGVVQEEGRRAGVFPASGAEGLQAASSVGLLFHHGHLLVMGRFGIPSPVVELLGQAANLSARITAEDGHETRSWMIALVRRVSAAGKEENLQTHKHFYPGASDPLLLPCAPLEVLELVVHSPISRESN